jgi:cytochrome c553
MTLAKRIPARTAIAVALAALCGAAQAQQRAASHLQNNLSMCIGCHGIPGYKTAYPEVYHVPMLGGQSQKYLVNALRAYRSGGRSHPSMRGIAASLSDKDMDELAAYYAGIAK